jgi:hypothetical protein
MILSVSIDLNLSHSTDLYLLARDECKDHKYLAAVSALQSTLMFTFTDAAATVRPPKLLITYFKGWLYQSAS